jgi:hypothetical protein
MPSGPYQFLSRICPVTGFISGLCSDTISKPFEFVVRSKPAIRVHLRFRTLMASIGTYLGHGTLQGRSPERRGRLPKWLRDNDGLTTVQNTALNPLGAIADSGFKAGQSILWIRCRSLCGHR